MRTVSTWRNPYKSEGRTIIYEGTDKEDTECASAHSVFNHTILRIRAGVCPDDQSGDAGCGGNYAQFHISAGIYAEGRRKL